jgi:hypothetical protein
MASYVDQDEAFGFVDKRRGRGQGASALATPANYVSDGALETRLAAINGAYFTTARLNQMTHNDKVMAVRLADDAAGVK